MTTARATGFSAPAPRVNPLAVALLLLLVPTGSAWAQERWFAFAWVNNGVASPSYQFNSAGGAITVANPFVGSFSVTIPNIAATGGIVHAVAYGGNHYCNSGGWGPLGGNQVVTVLCYTASGAPVNADFSVLYYRENRAAAEWSDAYLWANQPTLASYVPNATHQYNSRGGPNTVTRLGTGRYVVTFPGLWPLPNYGSVMVTAYGSNARCHAARWGGDPVTVDVWCNSPAAGPVDAFYNVSFITDTAFGVNGGHEQRRGAFVFAHDPIAASYTPSPGSQYNSAGGPIRVRRTGTGAYAIDIPGLRPIFSNAQVTRQSAGRVFLPDRYCNVLNWSGGPNNGTTVNVRCHDAAGAAQDATFGLTYLTDELPVFPLPAPGGPDRAKAFVWSDVTGSNLNPSAAYSFNSGGGTNTVTQLEPGIYRVDFPDIGTAGGIVHVNAYDSDAYCKAHSWGPNGTTQEVYVLCFGPSGAAVSSRFSVLFYKEDRPNATFNAAYTRSLIPITTEPVVPPTAYSWNGRRLANGVSRTGVGRYRVTFTGVVESPNRGSAIATAYGPMPTRCKVVGWIAPLVDVFCHQIDGTPIDSEFGLSYFTDVAFGADTLANGHPGAFVFADQPASASYDPGGGYRFNSLGGTFAASRSAAGSYAIDFGLHKGSNKTMPIITAHGTTPAELDVQCHQDGWTGVAAGARILVACYNAAGVRTDSRFTVVYLSDNTSPTTTDIANRSIPRNSSTGAIPFTIGDDITQAASLSVAATSSNTTLVPNANIVFGGAGSARTVTVTPAPSQIGTATITVNVADGQGLVGTDTFVLTVTAPPTTVEILVPTSAAATTASSAFLRIGGTATSDDTVTSITWATDRGFSGAGEITTTVVTDGTAADLRTWEAAIPLLAGANAITVTATDSAGSTGTDTLTVTVSSVIYYLAEGATGSFFDLELALANPNTVAAPVDIQYLKEDGTTVAQSLTLTPQSRQTILVDSLAGLAGTAVSAVVTSPGALPLGVERTMTWDASGYGAHTEKATPGAALTWYFAEGSEQGFFDTYLLLANPQAVANTATVQFLIEGGSPVTKTYTLLPTSRTNVFAEAVEEPSGTKALLNRAFGIVVSFALPGVAERAMYFGTAPFWNGGHESAGVNVPSQHWFHAEGATGPFFDTFILLSNPNPTPATVTLTYLLDSGATVVRTKTIPASARLTVAVEFEDALLANAATATQVASDLPIVSERAMYWAGPFETWYEAHNSFGVTSTGTKWVLGEGRAGGARAYETYILLANPGATAATVTLTYLREGGLPPIVRTKTVNATTRFNVLANSDGLGDGERFGVLIESTQPIAVERAMYSNAASQPGLFWAAGTNASATRIP